MAYNLLRTPYAYMRGGPVATDNLCPLWSQPDSGSHVLGGCAHPEMQKVMIHRHDDAHRIINKAIMIDPWLGSGRQRKIWIVEGGYCADTKYAEKVKEKNKQHEKLVDMLNMYGYDVHQRPMPLGYAATIYNCNLSMLQASSGVHPCNFEPEHGKPGFQNALELRVVIRMPPPCGPMLLMEVFKGLYLRQQALSALQVTYTSLLFDDQA
ncbi:MAG: hypothetical protein FRX49_02237 [Trebouxia sp. A1-2]|nr:MAG: hypothetical protein FRX49_02237 [Trebouxia sp. A1-2]